MELCMYEGYIRNRLPLCEELGIEAAGDLKDTERRILLFGYRRWGRGLMEHLYGSFAFVIRDEEKQELFCARDPFGIEDFYYCLTGDGKLLYGSDIRPIVSRAGFEKKIDPQALQHYMAFGYPVGERTLYRGVYKLLPGRFLVFSDGRCSVNTYFSPRFRPENDCTEEEWVRRIDETLQAILAEDRSNFDFSACRSFLSGGVDSAYLLAASGVKNACCIAYSDERFSEEKKASVTAQYLGAQLHKVQITSDEYFAALPAFLRQAELPLADAAVLAFSIGCKEVAEHTRLCMSGEGADEFFAGYYAYLRADENGRIGGKPYFGCSTVMDGEDARRYLQMEQSFPCAPLLKETCATAKDFEVLSRMLSVDISLWLEGDILFGVRRAARANGVNILLPFADRRIFELSARIPSALKRNGNCAKYILRRAAEKRLPHEIAFRDKVGFSVPVRAWVLEEPRRGEVEKVLFGENSAKFFDQALLHDTWRLFCEGDPEVFPVLWTAYIFLIWYETVFLGGGE